MAWLLGVVGLASLAVLHEMVRLLAAKRWRHAVAIPIAAVVHYLAIAALGFAFAMTHGTRTGESTTVVARVASGFDAETKLRPGDRVLAIDHVELGNDSVNTRVNAAGGRAVVFTIDRDGSIRDVELQPKIGEGGRWLVGFFPRRLWTIRRDPVQAAQAAITLPAVTLWELAKEALPGDEHADFGGPTRIAEEVWEPQPVWWVAVFLLLRFASLALVIHLVVDVIRARRS